MKQCLLAMWYHQFLPHAAAVTPKAEALTERGPSKHRVALYLRHDGPCRGAHVWIGHDCPRTPNVVAVPEIRGLLQLPFLYCGLYVYDDP